MIFSSGLLPLPRQWLNGAYNLSVTVYLHGLLSVDFCLWTSKTVAIHICTSSGMHLVLHMYAFGGVKSDRKLTWTWHLWNPKAKWIHRLSFLRALARISCGYRSRYLDPSQPFSSQVYSSSSFIPFFLPPLPPMYWRSLSAPREKIHLSSHNNWRIRDSPCAERKRTKTRP